MDSGIEWLPEIPAKWEICATKRRFDIFLGKMLQSEPSSAFDLRVPYLKAVNIQWERVGLDSLPFMWASPKEVKQGSLEKGDLLVCEGGEVGRAAMVSAIPEFPTIIQNALHRVRSRSALPKYLMYLLEVCTAAGWLEVVCNRATIRHFARDKFGALNIVLPSLAEQHHLVAYLDRETAKIDALIEKKEQLIELLQEKRTALITEAVTKGLDPNVPMKDSGVEWLGQIPAHWQLETNKKIFRESNIRSRYGEEELLTVSHITGVTRHSEKSVNMIKAESHEDYKICRKNELAINTMWAWMGALGTAKETGMVSPSYNVYKIKNDSLNPRFYDYLCRIPNHANELTRHSMGIWKSRLRLYPDGFYEISTPIPPWEEQLRIIGRLDSMLYKIKSLKAAIEKALDKLAEYRMAMISAAVTGKIDVRET